jgi:quercetin dioxygenase-like cupin family protein
VKITKGSPDVHTALFGGRGVVSVWNLTPQAPEPFTAILSCELSPDGSVGPHVQEHFPEIVVGVEGEGSASVDGVAHPLGAGHVVHLPLGSVLAIENRSAHAPLRYMIIKARDVARGAPR